MHYGKPTEGAWAAMKASLGNLAVHNVDQLAAIMMYAVVMEAYIAGVSTRSVDDLVAALGIDSGISKSEVSRICVGLDQVVTPSAPTAGPHHLPLRLPRRDLPARGQPASQVVVSMAVVVATGITAV